MRDLAASGIPAEVSLQMLGLGRSPYYRWRVAPVTESELREAYLANAIFDAHRDDPEFGYRFLFDEVTDAGYAVTERTV
ncbi:MAG: integrase [Nocardioides sp.]|nr:integrase [Nocardioides sp.]